MIAPSEKHLEDWIVANLRQFGPTYEAEIFPDYVLDDLYRIDDEFVVCPILHRVVARQYHLPAGIADLIGVGSTSVYAVEIKKGAVDSLAITQCLRYMHDLKEIMYYLRDFVIADEPDRMNYYYPPLHRSEVSDYPTAEVCGIVVGHSISEQLLLVCAAADIMAITYDYYPASNSYTFTAYERNTGSIHDYREYAQGKVGQAFREILSSRSRSAREYRETFS